MASEEVHQTISMDSNGLGSHLKTYFYHCYRTGMTE